MLWHNLANGSVKPILRAHNAPVCNQSQNLHPSTGTLRCQRYLLHACVGNSLSCHFTARSHAH